MSTGKGGSGPVTRIATSDATSIHVGGRNLLEDLVGKCSFTEMLYFLTVKRMPTPAQTRILDACMVTLMEHGLTPSAVIARLMADSVPEEPQVAMAAGLLAIGSVFAGTTEQCARMLLDLETRIARGEVDAPRKLAEEYAATKKPVPGFGHTTHKPDDPRSEKLFTVLERDGEKGRYIELLRHLSAEVDNANGRHITINATGAIGALFLEIGIQVEAMRGFSVVSRSGGLVGHLLEEQETHSGRAIWMASKAAVRYEAPED